MSEFSEMLQAGIDETAAEMETEVLVDAVGTFPAIWQENERGKDLQDNAGFVREEGGTLVFRKSALTGINPNDLSHKRATKMDDGTSMRIVSVSENRITFTCTLQALNR